MRLRFLPEAIADLVAVRDHVATYRPDRAGPLVDRLIDRVRLLAEHPDAGERLPRLCPGIRRLTEAPYRIEAEEVRIVRILHGARRIGRRLLPPA